MGYEVEITERQPEVTAVVVGRVPRDGVGPFIGEARAGLVTRAKTQQIEGKHLNLLGQD